MKTFAITVLWFLGIWVSYEMIAFALGMPRQLAPFVALGVALTVSKALMMSGSRGTEASSPPSSPEISFRDA